MVVGILPITMSGSTAQNAEMRPHAINATRYHPSRGKIIRFFVKAIFSTHPARTTHPINFRAVNDSATADTASRGMARTIRYNPISGLRMIIIPNRAAIKTIANIVEELIRKPAKRLKAQNKTPNLMSVLSALKECKAVCLSFIEKEGMINSRKR
jgi:hypothetical protein